MLYYFIRVIGHHTFNNKKYNKSIFMSIKTSLLSKLRLLFLGSSLFMISMFFGGQASAANCYWTAASSTSASDMTNWSDGLGGNCVSLDGNDLIFINSESSADAIFDADVSVASVLVDNTYVGTITVTSSISVTTTNNFTLSGGVVQVNGTLNVDGTLGVDESGILNASGDLNLSGNLSVTTTLNQTAGTTKISGTDKVVDGGGTINLYNFIADSASTSLSTGVSVGNDLTINSSDVLEISNGVNLAVSGDVINNGTLTANGDDTLSMSGTGVTLGGSGSTSLSRLTITGSVTLNGDIDVSNTLTDTGTLSASSQTITLSATGTPFVLTGGSPVFNSDSSLVMYSGATASIAPTTYYNLIISNSTAGTLTGSTTVSNILSVISGKTLSAGGSQLTLYGTGTPLFVDPNASFNANTSTVIFSGATSNIASTTYYNLTVNSTSTLVGSTTVANVLTINSNKSLIAGGNQLTLSGDSTPFVNNGTFTVNTSTIIYSGSTANIVSTTYYNLTLNTSVADLTGSTTVQNTLSINSGTLREAGNEYLTLSGTGTPFSNSSAAHLATSTSRVNVKFSGTGVNIPSAVYYNLWIYSSSSTLMGNVTSTNALIISSGKKLNASSYTIVLNTNSGSVFQNSGTFNADSSTVYYANTGSVTTSPETYYNLTLGTGTYYQGGNTTSSNAFSNSGIFNVGNYNLVISAGTYTNSGTTTLSGTGVIKKAASGGMTATSYTSGSGNGTGNSISISLTDPTVNLLANTIETKTVTLSATTYSDAETVTLTETTASSGVFQSSIPFNITSGASSNSGKVDVSGSGTVTLAYSNGYGSLSGSGTSATYSGATYSVSGGGSSPSSPAVSVSASAVSVSPSAVPGTVNLSFSTTNASQVAISEDPAFGGASWETYASSKQFKVSNGSGQKTIYVKFRSSSGGVTPVYNVSINLKASEVVQIIPNVVSSTPTNLSVDKITQFTLYNPDSKLVILPIKKLEYTPNSSVFYTYQFKNETPKTLKIKVLRQLLGSDGKVLSKLNGSTSIAKGKTFKSKVSSFLNSKLLNGNYTVQVKIMDSKNNILAENGFGVTVKKPEVVKKVTKTTKKK